MTQPQLVISDRFLAAAVSFDNRERGRILSFLEKLQKPQQLKSLNLEPIDGAASEGIWSARVDKALRAVLFRKGPMMVLLHVDQHDDAYAWARRHSFDRHESTGSWQVLPVAEALAERIAEVVPSGTDTDRDAGAPVFSAYSDEYLTSIGVPLHLLPALRQIQNEDQLLGVLEELPEDLSERLLRIHSGQVAVPPTPVAKPEGDEKKLEFPQDAEHRRSFWVIDDEEELQRFLSEPFERWLVFLHPSQRDVVEREYGGPAKVTGSAGTGKTVVALHRARWHARRGERVLLTTYGKTLKGEIERNLQRLCSRDERRLVDVRTVHSLALSVVREAGLHLRTITDKELLDLLGQHAPADLTLPMKFVAAEWREVIEAQGIESWEQYRDAKRVGRQRSLQLRERKKLWELFASVQSSLEEDGRCTFSGLCHWARWAIEEQGQEVHYEAVIVDEVQDLRRPEMLFLFSICANESLMLVGDAGQRIYAGGFSLKQLGVDTRGRARILRLNYRTTEQIRRAADRVMAKDGDDLDGGKEDRSRTRSLLQGGQPELRGFDSEEDELAFVAENLHGAIERGIPAHNLAVFAREKRQLFRARKALAAEGLHAALITGDSQQIPNDVIPLMTMHRAKGLEFRRVHIIGCSAQLLPHQRSLDECDDEFEREQALNRERSLLYVCMTRAREELVITWTGEPTRWLPE